MYFILSVIICLFSCCLATKALVDIKPFFMTAHGFGLVTSAMPLTKVLHQYAKVCDRNVYVDAKVSGTVKARIIDASCDDLLSYFIQAHALTALNLAGGIYLIPAAKEPKRTQEIPLKYYFVHDAIKRLKKKIARSTQILAKLANQTSKVNILILDKTILK